MTILGQLNVRLPPTRISTSVLVMHLNATKGVPGNHNLIPA